MVWDVAEALVTVAEEKPPAAVSRAAANERLKALLGAVVDGRYELVEVIARGAMGSVYKANHHPLNRPVAVKLLDPIGQVDDPEVFETRFLREASTLARLQHPNSVRVYDYGQWEGRTFLVMEYIDGHSFKRMLAGGALPPTRMVDIAIQMCGALHEAHSLGLIHRDLKPGNVLLTRHPGALDVVKVVDFGLAKGYYPGDPELTAQGQVLGTPMYMPPEQIRDELCDQRVDIYALGVLLYRGFTGETPFPRGKTMAVLMANLQDDPRAFSEVAPEINLPPVVEYVVRRCLEKKADNRFASVMELRKALLACERAVKHPSAWDMQIRVEDGVAIVPDEWTEVSLTNDRIPEPTPQEEPQQVIVPAPESAGVPRQWALLAAVMSLVAGAGLTLVAVSLFSG